MKAFGNVKTKYQAFHHSFLILKSTLKEGVGGRIVPKVTYFLVTFITKHKYSYKDLSFFIFQESFYSKKLNLMNRHRVSF